MSEIELDVDENKSKEETCEKKPVFFWIWLEKTAIKWNHWLGWVISHGKSKEVYRYGYMAYKNETAKDWTKNFY